MHCRDIARAIYLIIHKGKMGEIYNAGVDKPESMRNLVEIVCKILNKNFEDSVNITEGRIGEDMQYWLNSDKLFKVTNKIIND